MKIAIKREQSQVRLSSAEREQFRASLNQPNKRLLSRAARMLHHSAARFMLAIVLTMLTTLTAQATDFITDVMVIGNNNKTQFNNLQSSYETQGWTAINKDLNAGCGDGSDYIHLLYKITASQGSSGIPITDFYIKTGNNPPASLEHDGRTYYLVAYDGSTNFKNSKGDLNRGAAGDYIHLYYTKDKVPGQFAVTGIAFNDTQSGAVGKNGGTTGYDLNAGCGSGTNYIYMHVTTANITGANVVMLTSASTTVELQDGDMLTGTGGPDTHITIADGATVTLSGVDVTAITIDEDHSWPGITCLGDAVIILDEDFTNTVRGGCVSAGIYVPKGKTLTIQGSGTLNATGEYDSAGIGSGFSSSYRNCGNITISGGIVTSTGGNYAAGIGSGPSSTCGNIVIEGGIVTAYGGLTAAGIGSGHNLLNYATTCGDITITNGVTMVTAIKGEDCSNSIGFGIYGSCGTVTIGNVQTGKITESPFTTHPYTVSFDANDGTGTMADMSFMYGVAQNLTANSFTRPGYLFLGWATSANGAVVYNDGQNVNNLTETSGGTVTLYAKWAQWRTGSVTLTTGAADIALTGVCTLSGTGGSQTRVIIADGATVTLSGVNITSIVNNQKHQWPGISCLGNAVIILEKGKTNNVNGGYKNPGIHVTKNKTLTIQGSGTLNATGDDGAAGIGSGPYNSSCGNIIISGGTINATGGDEAAGIGSGSLFSSCGDIVIEGGIVTAQGGSGGPGIGGGASQSSCGDITITNGVTMVTATKGADSNTAIGYGRNSSYFKCGTITIGGIETGGIAQSSFTTYPYTVSFDANGGTGTMADMSFMYGVAQNLTANSFIHPQGYSFVGWATTPNGENVYDDRQSVNCLTETSGATVTLYVKWNLVTLTSESGDVLLSNGKILTGTGGTHTHVTIADGATVTLSDVNITAIDVEDSECQWAGITCLGDAVIILAEGTTNNVKGGRYSSGIFVPEGKTLTIQGSGILNASSDEDIYGYSAGIGGSKGSNRPTFNSYQTAAGNIVIAGGTVNANGGWMAAGIGSGYTNSSCGNITITGGTVIANNGSNTTPAAGIGSGILNSSCGNITISGGTVVSYGNYESPGIGSGPYNSSCGNIVITNGVTMVTVTKGEECDITIGAGAEGSTCGTLTIGSTLTSEISGYTQWIYHQLILADNADNTSAISETNGITCLKATLTDRTLYKDGDWNTLCLPFGVTDGDATDYVTFSGTPLEGATVMELDTDGDYSGNQTGFDAATGTLYLYFKTATAIEAGKPYLVKWTKPDGYDLAPYEHNIFSPVFSSAAVTTAAPEDVTFADGLYTVSATNSGLRTVQFIGTYNPVALTPNDQSNLFLGDAKTLYYPNAANNADGKYYVNPCRAYFHVDLGGQTNARAFVLGFGEDGEQTGIHEITDPTPNPSHAGEGSGCAWYTLDGRKILGNASKRYNAAPARLPKGIYIQNGKKVVIK